MNVWISILYLIIIIIIIIIIKSEVLIISYRLGLGHVTMICTLAIFVRITIALLLCNSTTNIPYMTRIVGDRHGIYDNVSV